MPREGTETFVKLRVSFLIVINLEIRCPERGRKHECSNMIHIQNRFGNKMPREGTETLAIGYIIVKCNFLFGNKMPREGTETILFLF